MIGIYKITSPSNKIYIGQSLNIERRFKEYKLLRCKKQIILQNSLNKYGVENHIFEIIEECNINELNTKERSWQEYYDVLNNNLNCVYVNTETNKRICSDKTKLKMSLAKLGKKRPVEFSETMRLIKINKKLSQETKDKIKLSNTGKKRNSYKINEFSGKKVIDNNTNKIYRTISIAAIEFGYSISHFSSMLSGVKKNKTNCSYL